MPDDPKPQEEGAEEQPDRALAVRTRLLLGSVSLSQSTSEKVPSLSVSTSSETGTGLSEAAYFGFAIFRTTSITGTGSRGLSHGI